MFFIYHLYDISYKHFYFSGGCSHFVWLVVQNKVLEPSGRQICMTNRTS